MKFVVSDLDGTLLQPDHLPSEYAKKAITKLIDKGINFVIATGRGKLGVQDIMKKLDTDIFLICNNGANIYNKEGKLIYEDLILSKIASAILQTVKNNNHFYSAFRENNYYRDKEDERHYPTRTLFTQVILDTPKDCPDVNKIIVVDEDTDIILKINDILREKFDSQVEITLSQPTCIDISPKGCTKGAALRHLAEIFNLNLDEFMAFGDGENDLDMLRTAGHPVIMANSQEIIKKEFHNMTLSNIDDGVAKYIEKYFNL